MTARILPPAEYGRLVGTDAEAAVALLTDAARVVVVEDAGQIIGCHVLQPVLHAECLWIHPDHRGRASVARRLWATVRRTVREQFHVEWFATGCDSPAVEALLTHVQAHKLPDHYMVPIGAR